ncbi:amidohydrolase [Nakamurella antarctica]|uniref:Amidohydrolase n=1 Tax=Nakamurella antarctica TaxID=1902245 RepID=A0A3G8ZP29_9ACTN|nr:amidohydrolase [Nakamurella antarctica]AZI58557.1 amidohydrolase [Nakamurella antarctica]
MSSAHNSHNRPVVPPAGIPDLGTGHGPDWLDKFLQDNLATVLEWRRDIHAHPELSHLEHRTTDFIASTLDDAGIVSRIFPGGTGLMAEVGPAGSEYRTVGLRADVDALPLPEATGLGFSSTVEGVSHACGHDAHLAIVLGAALALNSAPDLPGRVRFLFQPAEEIQPGGAYDVVEAGGINGVDRIFALHCDPRTEVGKVGLKVGPITSTADVIEIRLTSPGGHTARPHLTGDLVFGLGVLITGLPTMLTRRMDPRSAPVLVWGAVDAGKAANAIPQSGSLKGTLRIMQREAWDAAEPLLAELTTELLAPLKLTHEFIYTRGVPPVVNDEESVELLREGIAAGLGEAAITTTEQSTGAEDFAVYLDHIPGALARLGVWDGHSKQVDLHSPTFELDERAIAVGIRTVVNVALAALKV